MFHMGSHRNPQAMEPCSCDFASACRLGTTRPVAIQPPVQAGIAPIRVALSGDLRSGTLYLDLFSDALTGIATLRHDHHRQMAAVQLARELPCSR